MCVGEGDYLIMPDIWSNEEGQQECYDLSIVGLSNVNTAHANK